MIRGNGGQCSNGLKRRLRRALVGAAGSNALAVALALPVGAAEVTEQSIGEPAAANATHNELAQFKSPDSPATQLPPPFKYQWVYGDELDITRRANPDLLNRVDYASLIATPQLNAKDSSRPTSIELAQFQLPPTEPDETVPSLGAPPRPLVRHLTYQYSYGSESDITYRRNPDLNRRVKDNSLVVTPQVNAHILYRPTSWLEATLEMIFEREIPAQEQKRIVLPDGSIQINKQRRFSLLIDQAFLKFKDFIAPFEFMIGRRNYEDERHWLYDTSMDTAAIALQLGAFRAEAVVGRQVLYHLDLVQKQQRDRINTYMLYADYRGIEDIRLAAYTIFREDRDRRQEGRPITMGLRAQGQPSNAFNYWIELAHMRGHDEFNKDFSAHALDVGATYRFLDLPFNPNITLGYAFGSGNNSRNKGKNNEFRQTGLQSNETRFAGLSEFKIYGEALDPELSNLKIFTVGVGFRPLANMTVDLVYHRYRSHEITEGMRNSPLTAEMNQVDTRQPSKDVGDGFDIVLGFRRLFGSRLGVDLRAGWFFPGKAFLRADQNDVIRSPNRGFTTVAKFWW